MQLGGEEEEEKAGEDLSDDEEEEEEGEGVGEGGGGAAGGDQAQSANQKEDATWKQIQEYSEKNIWSISDEIRIHLRPRRLLQACQGGCQSKG